MSTQVEGTFAEHTVSKLMTAAGTAIESWRRARGHRNPTPGELDRIADALAPVLTALVPSDLAEESDPAIFDELLQRALVAGIGFACLVMRIEPPRETLN